MSKVSLEVFRPDLAALLMLTVVALTLTACAKDELNREEAGIIIQEHFEYPREVTKKFYLNEHVNCNPAIKNFSGIGALADYSESLGVAGLAMGISLYNIDGTNCQYQTALVPLGETFVRGSPQREGEYSTFVNVVDYTIYSSDITGIVFLGDNGTLAQVEYTESYTASPFGLLLAPNKKSRFPEGPRLMKVRLRLYDDGWRVVE